MAKKEIKIREIPAKIKEIKKEGIEESGLEGEIAEAESEKFSEFVSQGGEIAPVLSSGERAQEMPDIETTAQKAEERAREEVPARVYQQASQERVYSSAEKARLINPTIISDDLRSEEFAAPRGGGNFGDRELARLRGEIEEASEAKYSIKIHKEETKRRMPWE